VEDLNVQVLRGFDLKPKTIYKSNSFYICETNKGMKALKKSKDSIENILLQHDIKTHLIHNGFNNTDMFSISKQNKPYYIFNNNVYVVTDFISNESINFQDRISFLELIKATAKLHVSLKNINFKQGDLPSGSDLSVEYSKSLNRLKSIKKKVHNQNRLSNFDVAFIKNYASYVEDINKAIQGLAETNYITYRNKALQEKSVCHNILKKESLIVTRNSSATTLDNIYITNFSKCTVDYNLTDISRVIKTYLKYIHEDPVSIEEVIDTYSKYNPLNDDEIKILYIFLSYPSKFIKVCNHYYFKQRKWGAASMTSRLETILEQREFLNKYMNNTRV